MRTIFNSLGEEKLNKYVESIYNSVVERDPLQKTFHQAVYEVLENITPAIEKYPVFQEHRILELSLIHI